MIYTPPLGLEHHSAQYALPPLGLARAPLYAAYKGAVKVVYSVLKDSTQPEDAPIDVPKLPWWGGYKEKQR